MRFSWQRYASSIISEVLNKGVGSNGVTLSLPSAGL